MPIKPSPKLTDEGTEVIALPAPVKSRLTTFKQGTEPYYKTLVRLMDFYEERRGRRG
jgi:hypothetical protein